MDILYIYKFFRSKSKIVLKMCHSKIEVKTSQQNLLQDPRTKFNRNRSRSLSAVIWRRKDMELISDFRGCYEKHLHTVLHARLSRSHPHNSET